MDGQPQFMRPAQHPFYVRKPLTFDSLHHSQLLGYNYGSKPVSFSVELPSRNGRRPQTGQLSEPHTREQSRSLRDIFERAILRGDVTIPAAAVALDHDNSDTGVTRQPSFITSSLPRKITRDGDDLVAVDASRGGSNDYFLDNSSESASESGWQNEAFMDDASSTVSDEIFKSSESPTEFGIDIELDEEDTHLTPLPNILDVSDITRQQGRSTLSGLFKPKYRDYPRNNVHRHSEKDHKEVIDSGTQRQTSKSKQQQLSASSTLEGSVHRLDPVHDHGRLPRTPFPAEQRERSQSPMSHYRYLPNHLGRKSPRPRSPRARTHQDTGFNDIETGDEIISIHPDARPAFHRSTGNLSGHEAFEQMEVEEPPWVKERQRRLRKCRRIKLVSMSVTLGVLLFLTLAGVGVYFLVIKSPVRNHVPESTDVPSLTNTTITSPGQEEKTFNGSIRITSENFTEAMWDLSSEPATNFSTRFCSAMDSVYNSNDFSYKGCSVTSLSKGSIVAGFRLKFGGLSKIDQQNLETTLKNASKFLSSFTFDELKIVASNLVPISSSPVSRSLTIDTTSHKSEPSTSTSTVGIWGINSTFTAPTTSSLPLTTNISIPSTRTSTRGTAGINSTFTGLVTSTPSPAPSTADLSTHTKTFKTDSSFIQLTTSTLPPTGRISFHSSQASAASSNFSQVAITTLSTSITTSSSKTPQNYSAVSDNATEHGTIYPGSRNISLLQTTVPSRLSLSSSTIMRIDETSIFSQPRVTAYTPNKLALLSSTTVTAITSAGVQFTVSQPYTTTVQNPSQHLSLPKTSSIAVTYSATSVASPSTRFTLSSITRLPLTSTSPIERSSISTTTAMNRHTSASSIAANSTEEEEPGSTNSWQQFYYRNCQSGSVILINCTTALICANERWTMRVCFFNSTMVKDGRCVPSNFVLLSSVCPRAYYFCEQIQGNYCSRLICCDPHNQCNSEQCKKCNMPVVCA